MKRTEADGWQGRRRRLGAARKAIYTVTAAAQECMGAFQGAVTFGGDRNFDEAKRDGYGYFDIIVTVIDSNLRTLDLQDTGVFDRLTTKGLSLKPNEAVKLVLRENGSTGYTYKVDDIESQGLFTVYSRGVAGPSRDSRGGYIAGAAGERHFTITAGDTEGTGYLFACETRGSRVVQKSSNEAYNSRLCVDIAVTISQDDPVPEIRYDFDLDD